MLLNYSYSWVKTTFSMTLVLFVVKVFELVVHRGSISLSSSGGVTHSDNMQRVIRT
jgi:hypothetical protein